MPTELLKLVALLHFFTKRPTKELVVLLNYGRNFDKMKKKTFMALIMSVCLLLNFALAECRHENVDHHYTSYKIFDNTYHYYNTVCKCMDCGAIRACCPQPSTTPLVEHRYTIVRRTYSTENLNQHTATITSSCICGYSHTDTISESHDYKYVSDYHGTGVKHYINYRCSLCNQTKTTTYNCPGNPCYMPALYRQPIEEE